MRSRGSVVLRVYLALGVLSLAGHGLAPTDRVADLLYLVISATAFLACSYGIRRHRPTYVVPWRWLQAGLGLAFAGTATAQALEVFAIGSALPRSLHGLAYSCSVALVWTLGRQRSGHDATDRVLASAIMATSASIVAWVFVVQPLWHSGTEGGLGGSLRALFPLLSLSVAAVLLRLLSADALRIGAHVYVAAGLVAFFLADLGDALGLVADALVGGGPGTVRLSAYLLLGAATLHASMQGAEHPVEREVTYRLSRAELLAVLVAGIAAPISLVVRRGGATRAELVVVGVGSAVLVGLVVGRMWRLMHAVADTAREETEHRFRALVENGSDVVCIVGPGGDIRYVSPSVERVWGYSAVEVQQRASEILDEDTCRLLRRAVAELAGGASGAGTRAEGRARHADGGWRHFEAVLADRTDDPAIGGIVITAHDVTARVDLERRLWNEAFLDELTGLPNRALLLQRLQQALFEGDDSACPSLVVLDLDEFKTINDSLGPHRGDELLRTVARRLAAVGEAHGTVARLAADAFAVLVPAPEGGVVPTAVVDAVIEAVNRPVMLAGRRIEPRVSVGVATGVSGATASDLLRDADAAMHVAKREARGSYRVFDPEMHAAAVRRLELQMDLASAVDRGQLWLAYQPIHEIRTGRMAGVEALVRWDHPTRGPVSPAEFIPLAEASGTIGPLGEHVLRQACHDLARHRQGTGADLTLSVNLSPAQLGDPGLADVVTSALRESGLPASRLTLEVTEGVFLDDGDGVMKALSRLRALGVRLAIDDFGTGYCALGYLTRFRFDIVKIDRSFIDLLGTSRADRRVTLGILEFVSSLQVPAVAEGIETAAQLDDLRAIGCEFGQGYHWSRPVRIGEIGVPAVASAPPGTGGAAARSVASSRPRG